MHLVVIGNGVAGISCAMAAREHHLTAEITVIGEETEYFFSRTALMYAFMDQMSRQDLEPNERFIYEKNRIKLVKDTVVDLNSKAKKIRLKAKGEIQYDKLVFAIGAKANALPNLNTEKIKEGLVNFVSMQDLDQCERLAESAESAVVVGGGLIGIELVECLTWAGVKVRFLVREPYFWPMALGKEEASFVSDHMREHGVELFFSEELKSVETDPKGKVKAVLTNKNRIIPCDVLGICVGVHPYIEMFKDFSDKPKLGRGILVNESLETSIKDVYACGDCAEIQFGDHKPFVELIWYSAKRQGALVGRNLVGDQTAYQPPIFFNSSKFFELEYTTVGEVMTLPEGTETLYLKMPNKDASIRIVHKNNQVVGFNMVGSRWDHETLEKWIVEKRSPDFCLSNLKKAQFDVEFGRVKFEAHKPQPLALNKGV